MANLLESITAAASVLIFSAAAAAALCASGVRVFLEFIVCRCHRQNTKREKMMLLKVAWVHVRHFSMSQ
jgi:hypothetical protein